MAAILQSLIFALRTVFVSFNFYQLVSINFYRLDRQMQDSMQNKIKQTTIAEYFA